LRTSHAALRQQVTDAVRQTPVFDIHTHLYDPAFGPLLLWGIDELLVYHYLIAETFRYIDLPAEAFWRMPQRAQADLIWEQLFLQHSPVSEACRGVLTTLRRLGLDVKRRDLPAVRRHFAKWKVRDYLTRCLELAGVERVGMTNSPFDDQERPVWERGFKRDDRFVAALRIDQLLLDWPRAAPRLRKWGYDVRPGLDAKSVRAVRRFLEDWTRRIDPWYLMASLPPSFRYPEKGAGSALLERAVLPHCREHGLPFAMMLGVKKLVNPELRLAGDSVGRSDIDVLEGMLAAYPDNKFLVTMLSRENQQELCVVARKFRNLHPFGCWWFTNVPLLIEEMTRLRLELVGLSLTPQHSDARVLDQVIYKWDHSRQVIGNVLADKYADLAATGWAPTRAEIQRDVSDLFGGAFRRFVGR